MIIENPEALKSWLTAVLAPLCDADPAALAKYVLALAKKEKPESELRGAMCDQLDVFLQQETKGFVDKLFVTLETKSYLQSNPEPPSAKVESTSTTALEQASTGVTNGQNLVIPPVTVPVQPPPVPVLSAPSTDSRAKKSSSDRTKRRSWSPRSRSRSRSRDRDRDRPARRSRSRDRSARDHRGGRSTWDDRRQSRRSPVSNRRSDRRRSRSPLPPRRSSRSPRGSRRARSPIPPPPVVAALDNVVVAPGLGLLPVGATATDPAIVVGVPVPSAAIQSVVVAPSTAAQQQHERGPKFRCRDYDEKGYCMRGDLCPYDHGADPVVLEDVELSSMLSTNYNRPPPPVGTTGAAGAPPGPLPVGPPPHLRGPPPSLPPSGEPYNPDAPGISWPPPPLVGLRPLGPPPPFGHPPSHRLPPPHMRIRGPLPPRGPPPMGLLGSAPPPRELINVPTAEEGSDSGLKRSVRDAGLDSDGHLAKKGHFDYNRLGNPPAQLQQQQQQQVTGQGNHGQPPQRRFDPTNCCLEVKKIPRGLNNISVLNNHFSKFGKIVNLQVSYNGDSEGALVTFSSHNEAQAAYRSTEAVLNNRFIKVFWHNKEASSPEMKGKQENVPPSSKVPIRERLGGAHPQRVLAQSQAPAPIVDEAALKEASEAKEKEREKAVAAIKRSQEILAVKEALKKKQEEQKREATKLQVDLHRRKQELLDKQLQQQRVLIERLEKNKSTIKTDERAAVMQTVRNLQETIEKLKKDLQTTSPNQGATVVANAPNAGVPSHPAKTPEEAKKEILDVEIELYQKQMEGSDTTELQRRVQELNSIISQSHRGHPSNRRGARISSRGTLRGRGRGLSARLSARGRGRGGYYVGPHVSVDRRPTQIKATGFENHQQGDILAHFANFGEVVDYHVDEDYPALTIRYKSRKDAEMALAQGRSFTGASLSVSWHMPPGSVPKVKDLVAAEEEDEHSAGRIEGSASAEEDEEDENEGLDDLLNYEEDDEDEERSWRR